MSKKKRSGFPQIIYHSKEEIEFSQKTTFVTKEVDGDSVISCPEAGKIGLFWSFFSHAMWYIKSAPNVTLTPKMKSDFENFEIWKSYGGKTWKFKNFPSKVVWYLFLCQNFMLNLNLMSGFKNCEIWKNMARKFE